MPDETQPDTPAAALRPDKTTVDLDNLASRILLGTARLDRDLEQRMYEQATLDSALYALEHMTLARPVRQRKFGDGGRLDLLDHALSRVAGDGFYAEFGVFNGASLAFIADRTDRIVYGFDAFEGLPGIWSASLGEGAFTRHGEPPEIACANYNFRILKGWFNETLPEFMEMVPGPAAFLHLDCYLHDATRDVLTAMKARIVPGTVIVFGQYINYPGWRRHQFKAFQDFCAENHLSYRYFAFAAILPTVAVIMV